MIDIMLRASSEQQCNQAMIASGIAIEETDHEGIVSVVPVEGVQIDRIGPCGADTRYHVNVRISSGVSYDADELPTFTPLPVTPYRVWFDG